MLATVVNASAEAAQVFFLIALIVFVVAGLVAVLRQSTIEVMLICAGLAVTAAGLLWLA